MGEVIDAQVAAPVDLAFMVYNYRLSNFTKRIYYADNTALLDQYSKGWIYGVRQK